ncbi:leucine-rich repeat flightless-interacting protein 2-like isoform X19 [Chiloscyllium punctatum]|uniref:leucine-rich repeat flightless-interacting protein 2-like isoform X19 n=1 Tax=Chiloscyllium punctatum TaxID=137246 RepID=UPI003B636FDB
MGTQGPGRKRIANRERLSAEDDALNLIAREAEARLAAKRAARAEAREIRMKELERQQKEIYQVQKKYYGLDSKFGDIEQWMEDSEKYSRRFRRHTSVSDEDDWTSVGSRGSTRTDYESIGACGVVAEKSRKKKKKLKAANGFDELSCGSGPSKQSSRGSCYSDLPLYSTGPSSKSHTASQNGTRVSAYDGSCSRRYSSSSSHALSEHNCFLGSGSRTSSRASSARASPVVEERLEKDFTEKSSRAASSLSAATLASLGGTSSRRGSGETTTSMDTEGSIREIKEIFELKDQIQDVEGKYMEGLKELKDSLAEVEEKYKKAMVSNAQLDNEKTNLMYQVDTLRESLLELEEQLAETHRMHEEKTKELDRQKHAYSILQHQFETMKETLKEREEMLTEIKGLNQKLISSTQEISDLQETVEWKDKKIGALERQKEYSDAIRIDRDELREEVAMLKERLKAYGLLTNGEAEPVRKDGNTYMEAAETGPQAATQLQSSSDGPLGEGHVLQMRNEILETVGQRGVLQNTGIDEQMEETGNREMLMNNVQEKDINEEYDELTEDFRTKILIDEKEALLEQIKKLKAQLDERTKNGTVEKAESSDTILENGTDVQVIEMQRDANRQISEYKFKLTKTEQEITALEQNIMRLESQVLRYKTAAENAEKVEDELKAEKRKLQREVRSAQDKIEELEMSNSHLTKRLEKMKANRSALLSQQ